MEKELRHNVIPLVVLPPCDDEVELILILEAIIEIREMTLRKNVIEEYLVK